MHMKFLSRGFKNLQWYGMTTKNLVTMPVARFFLCLLRGKYPLVYPLQIFIPLWGCGTYSHSNVNLFTPRHTFAGCLQSDNRQVKQLGRYGKTPGAASWAGVTVLRPALGVLCGLWRVLAGALLGDMSG